MSAKKVGNMLPKIILDTLERDIAVHISHALRKDFPNIKAAANRLAEDMKINMETLKKWYNGSNPPSAAHFIYLARLSPSVGQMLDTLMEGRATTVEQERKNKDMAENRFTTLLTPELCCTNIKTSLDFYVGILDFKIQYQRAEEGFAMLERYGSRIMLDQIIPGDKRSWITAPLEAPFGRGINLQMATSKVDELYAKVQNSGARIFLPMEEKWYRADDMELGNRQFIVQDPDGYLLRFFEDLGERPVTS